MTKEEIRYALKNLTDAEREDLLSEFGLSPSKKKIDISRRKYLNNKRGNCPHCDSGQYIKFGIDKGSQRYRCKDCGKTFTEYTGTFMSGLHHKELVEDYLNLMERELSLDKIVERLGINKKTAFDWRHKILSALGGIKKGSFDGITESDDMFLPFSEKGSRSLKRKSRQRGGGLKKGITDDKVAVIVTADRGHTTDFTLARRGRIRKKDIKRAIGNLISDRTILCSDSHVSYKGFAMDENLEHHPLRSIIKERVIQGTYHIQHVNSLHRHLKRWLSDRFLGVSTKYLQGYLYWFKVKQRLKASREFLRDFTQLSLQSTSAIADFNNIPKQYKIICN